MPSTLAVVDHHAVCRRSRGSARGSRRCPAAPRRRAGRGPSTLDRSRRARSSRRSSRLNSATGHARVGLPARRRPAPGVRRPRPAAGRRPAASADGRAPAAAAARRRAASAVGRSRLARLRAPVADALQQLLGGRRRRGCPRAPASSSASTSVHLRVDVGVVQLLRVELAEARRRLVVARARARLRCSAARRAGQQQRRERGVEDGSHGCGYARGPPTPATV